MEKPNILTSEIVYRGFFDVQQDLLERADRKKLPYTHFVLPNDAAVILAETSDGRLILNREYRHPTTRYILGCPGGTLNPEEDPLEGGRRELFEESGYISDDISLLGIAYPFPSLCNQKIYYVLAKNARFQGPPPLEPFEYIHTELKTEKEIQAAISAGEIVDGLLLTALSFRTMNIGFSKKNSKRSLQARPRKRRR